MTTTDPLLRLSRLERPSMGLARESQLFSVASKINDPLLYLERNGNGTPSRTSAPASKKPALYWQRRWPGSNAVGGVSRGRATVVLGWSRP